jgi:hypothetical protein
VAVIQFIHGEMITVLQTGICYVTWKKVSFKLLVQTHGHLQHNLSRVAHPAVSLSQLLVRHNVPLILVFS